MDVRRGIDGPASPSPHVVKLPLSVAEAVDPEEAAELDAMHQEAHDLCFIAHSVKTGVRCEAVAQSG